MKPETPNKNRTVANSSTRATITINGKFFDARTGQPLNRETRTPAPKVRQYGSFDIKPAGSVHAAPAKSQTLRRSGLVKPVAAKPLASRHVRTISPVATHPSVSRFAPARPSREHVVRPSEILSSLNTDDTAERPIGLATQVQNYSPASTAITPAKKVAPRSHVVTEQQLKNTPSRAQRAAASKAAPAVASRWKKFQRRIRLSPPLVVTGIIVLIGIISVVCYLTIPALSLFVAAKTANVEASYPNYVPAGFDFKGPVTYGDGDVKTEFVSSAAGTAFTITQKNTTWDSGAVLDNYVLAESSNYLTYSQGGITVYTFGSRAAWVSSGVLHTIDGNAALTSEQILHIAGSM